MELYKTYIRLWKSTFVDSGFSSRLPDYATRFWFEQLEQALPRNNQRFFLDIGAGSGRLSLLLLHCYSPQGIAIEVCPDRCSWEPILKRYGRFELREGFAQDILHTINNKRVVDFILLAEVFEHIPPADITPFLQALHAVLSPNGVIFLTTPNRVVQGPAQQSGMWHERSPYGHYKHYDYSELETILKDHGFIVESHAFEGHKLKKALYNRFFYPLARLDYRLTRSNKIPMLLKLAYRCASAPVISLARLYFWGVANIVYAIERRYSSQQSSETMLVVVRKAPTGF